MGRRKKKTTTVEEVLPPDALIDEDFREISPEDMPPDIANVIAEMGGSIAKVTLYRRTHGQKQAYLSQMDIDEFSVDEIARVYGGGRYLARFNAADGTFIKGHTFYIDETIEAQKKPSSGVTQGDGFE